MCGTCTTLVEAMQLGRRAVEVGYEARWAEVARANLNLAGPALRNAGQVFTSDACHLDWFLPDRAA